MLQTLIVLAATPTPTPSPSDNTCNVVTCITNNLGNDVSNAVGAVGNAVGGAAAFADFWSDPFGNTFLALQAGANGLAGTVIPAIQKATLPDLSAAWFIKAYEVSFAIGLMAAILLLIPQFVRTARGQQSGREMAESVGLYFPLFLIGAMFGPAIGIFLTKFIGALTDSITTWAISGSSHSITDQMTAMLSAKDAAGIAGGAPVGILFMLLMILGLAIVMVMLVVQLVTLYFLGVAMPLGYLWIVERNRRSFGMKIISAWVTILLAHPLLFFLLGVAYLMLSSNISVFSNTPTLQTTVTLLVSIIAMFFAGLSPLFLPKLVGVLPGGGVTSSPPNQSQSIGPNNTADANRSYQDSGSDTRPPTSTSSGETAAAADADPSRGSSSGLADAASEESTGESVGASAASGAGAGAGGAGAAAAGGGAAAEGASAAAAEGAATAATGGGAAAVLIAKAAVDGVQRAEKQLEHTAESPVRDHDAHYGRNDLNG